MKPISFFNEPIQAVFSEVPTLEKKPGLPSAFNWRRQHFIIAELLTEWHDYERRGRMKRNMREEHSSSARKSGSWGVGLDYYRVRTFDGRIFDLYFDRSPQDVDRRKGGWYLFRELADEDGPD